MKFRKDMNNQELENLGKALDAIARVSGGFAMIFDQQGRIIKSTSLLAQELMDQEVAQIIDDILHERVDEDKAKYLQSKNIEGAAAWVLPWGDYFLAAGNLERIRKDQELKANFKEALPLIAKVAGGEAVMFNQDGFRFASVGPDGQEIKGTGEYTWLGHKAMQTRRAVLGPSLLEEGAQALRIPINEHFGIGFNNVLAVKHKKILAKTDRLAHTRYTFEHIIGNGQAIQRSVQQARQVAASNSTLIIYGETGTGKELFAQSIHNASPRCGGPFIVINCGAIPASLIESHLFGYEAGAFTGAKREGQQGLFEQANGGTLFLDEISEMELELQSRLLRVLQEREVVRLGGKKRIPIDVRIITSTNKDLWQMAVSGKFRQDLFYRLNVVDLRIPSLRERVEDIPLLAKYFINQFRASFGTFVQDISPEAVRCLQCYTWPGNVRELQNCIERIMNLTTNEIIQVEDLPALIRESYISVYDKTAGHPIPLENATRRKEREIIIRALEVSGHNRRVAAEKLGISTTTLWRKMKYLGIM